jgi:hypothetical protein
VGLEQGPLSLVSATEELLRRKSSGSGLEIREYGRGDPLCWPCNILYLLMLALTSLGRIDRSLTQATEIVFFLFWFVK